MSRGDVYASPDAGSPSIVASSSVSSITIGSNGGGSARAAGPASTRGSRKSRADFTTGHSEDAVGDAHADTHADADVGTDMDVDVSANAVVGGVDGNRATVERGAAAVEGNVRDDDHGERPISDNTSLVVDERRSKGDRVVYRNMSTERRVNNVRQ
jgi:hypothetical protein